MVQVTGLHLGRGGGVGLARTWRSRRPEAENWTVWFRRRVSGRAQLVPGVPPTSKVPHLTIAPAAVTQHPSSPTTDTGMEGVGVARKGLSRGLPSSNFGSFSRTFFGSEQVQGWGRELMRPGLSLRGA